MDWDAFFTVHSDLPREGPGGPEDVAWACHLAGLARDANICDAGSGPGGDIAALLHAAPQGRVVAIDTHAPFVAQARARFAGDPRVQAQVADMATLGDLKDAPFDLIWSAGALYFMGLEAGLPLFASALRPGGAAAFSYPCYFTDAPSAQARAFWQGFETPCRDALLSQVEGAGFTILGDRALCDASWEAYYKPLEARIAQLRPGADAALSVQLDENAAEAALWRQVRDETGYRLIVARPA